MRFSPLVPLVMLACSGRTFGDDDPTGMVDTGPTGVDPCVKVEPGVIDFGTHPVRSDEPARRSFAISNLCGVPLTIEQVAFDQPDPPFTLEPPIDQTLVLEGRQSVLIGVRYEPRLYRLARARLRITNDDIFIPEVVVAMVGEGICPGSTEDSDGDFVPDGCDLCEGFPDQSDGDDDGTPDACDLCPTFDERTTPDIDMDGVADPCDVCPGGDDKFDADDDGTPDDCDRCPGGEEFPDLDGDFVPQDCDICPGFDDRVDLDSDEVPDGCDACPGEDDRIDDDGNGTPDCAE